MKQTIPEIIDFSILENGNDPILVLICRDVDDANHLYKMFKEDDSYVLDTIINPKSPENNITLRFRFSTNKIPFDTILFNSNINVKNYPPVKHLLDKSVKSFSVGYNSDGLITYNQDLLQLLPVS